MGDEYPQIDKIISIYENGELVFWPRMRIDFKTREPVVDFGGLVRKTGFAGQMKELLDL